MFYCTPNVTELALRVAVAGVEFGKVIQERATLLSLGTISQFLCDKKRHNESPGRSTGLQQTPEKYIQVRGTASGESGEGVENAVT